jgi:acyl-CoA synthetase (AMP-forming)/AMP-acid ligase II
LCSGLRAKSAGHKALKTSSNKQKYSNGLENPGYEMKTFAEIVDLQREKYAEKPAYIFLLDGEENTRSLSYDQLEVKAKSLAVKLSKLVDKKDRILLCYPPGLEYIIAFYACLYSGALAVPLYPPDKQNPARIYGIAQNSRAKIALCSAETLNKLNAEDASEELQMIRNSLEWLSTDVLNETKTAEDFQIATKPSDTAFLQYTSGSTSDPKGVLVTHANLVANCQMMQEVGPHHDGCVKISWLPPYHDMGLIGSILQPVYSGMTSIIMSPASFIKRPVRWLQAISKYKNLGSVTSGGPNFSYDWCCDCITESQMEGLDLSGWRIAYNGAEPVRAGTLRRFYEKFKCVGFRYSSFKPVYGLAEATLMASYGKFDQEPVIKNFNISMLNKGLALEAKINGTPSRQLVGCGRSFDEQKIVIADPDTAERLENNRVGEIWIKGICVAEGYWDNKKATRKTFNQYLKSTVEGPFLRTGDLGFIDNESRSLFITGRIKELIIIHGQNYYPQDIEEEAEQTSDWLKPRSGAAFSIDVENAEALVLVYEVNRRNTHEVFGDDVFAEIREAIFKRFGLSVFDIVLIEPSSFPKTTSGKLQRQFVKKMYLSRELKRQQMNFQNIREERK